MSPADGHGPPGPGAGDRQGRTLLILRRHPWPFTKVEGLFTVLICIPCLEIRQAKPDTRFGLHDPGPYPPMTRDQLRASLDE
jgi:hypothetical protein